MAANKRGDVGGTHTELHFLVEFNQPLQALQDAEVREIESYTNDMQREYHQYIAVKTSF